MKFIKAGKPVFNLCHFLENNSNAVCKRWHVLFNMSKFMKANNLHQKLLTVNRCILLTLNWA